MYPALNKVLAAAHWNQNFELDERTVAFLAKYKLDKDIQKPNNDYAALKPEVAQKLMDTLKIFSDNPHIAERQETVAKGVKADFEEKFAERYPDLKDAFTAEITVGDNAQFGQKHFSVEYTLNLNLLDGKDEFTFSDQFHEAVQVSFEEGSIMSGELLDAQSQGFSEGEVNWKAWLGDVDSPFYDDTFSDSYEEDYASIAIEEFYHTRGESLYWDELDKAINSLMAEYTPIYLYSYHEERGEFRGSVEDKDGKEVFKFDNQNEGEEGRLWITEDGFMKHVDDVAGLESYLKDMDIIPKDARLQKA